MTRPLGQLPRKKLALLLLLCAVALGVTLLFNRSYYYPGPNASEIPPAGHQGELPPVW